MSPNVLHETTYCSEVLYWPSQSDHGVSITIPDQNSAHKVANTMSVLCLPPIMKGTKWLPCSNIPELGIRVRCTLSIAFHLLLNAYHHFMSRQVGYIWMASWMQQFSSFMSAADLIHSNWWMPFIHIAYMLQSGASMCELFVDKALIIDIELLTVMCIGEVSICCHQAQ